MPRKKDTTINDDKYKKVAEKVESDIDEGFKILMDRWNKPYEIDIDDVTIEVRRPNLSQTIMMLSSVQSLTNPPKTDNIDEVVQYLDKVRSNIAPVLASLIISPRPLNSREFWESGEYPFDFMVRLITEILNRFSQETQSVDTFRED